MVKDTFVLRVSQFWVGFKPILKFCFFFAVFPLLNRLGCQKIYQHWNEASESENENSSETSEQNETTCRYAQDKKIQKPQ